MTQHPTPVVPRRTAGVLLHPTSLPGPYGIGDLGPSARRWVDQLAAAGQSWWQVLPLGPVGAGDSPYQSFSAFAGSPLLVSPDEMVADGLLRPHELIASKSPANTVDYVAVGRFKADLLATAWERFCGGSAPSLRPAFEAFRADEAIWLDDFALFMALKDRRPEGTWIEWSPALVRRESAALVTARQELSKAVGRHQFAQFLFFRQLRALRAYAADRNVRLFGDLPIFISPDSADVWANQHLFQLGQDHRPTVVAGVPPDYFATTGQRWGNPHYDWEAMRADGFAWWVARVRAALAQVDLIRLDHFRGFESAWAIPATCPTAMEGHWVPAPGSELLETLRREMGGLPFVAEDLGIITPEVDALRLQFGLPGMRVLQFAFGGAVEGRFLPHGFDHNLAVYTGTHDNNTTAGWAASLTSTERAAFQRYTPEANRDPVGAILRLAMASVADTAVVPLQDILRLGTTDRMNLPGTSCGNWRWRATREQLVDGCLDEFGELTTTYGRTTCSVRTPSES